MANVLARLSLKPAIKPAVAPEERHLDDVTLVDGPRRGPAAPGETAAAPSAAAVSGLGAWPRSAADSVRADLGRAAVELRSCVIAARARPSTEGGGLLHHIEQVGIVDDGCASALFVWAPRLSPSVSMRLLDDARRALTLRGCRHVALRLLGMPPTFWDLPLRGGRS